MRPKEGTNIELQKDICQIWLQIVCCRIFACILQGVSRLFAVRDPYLIFYNILYKMVGPWVTTPVQDLNCRAYGLVSFGKHSRVYRLFLGGGVESVCRANYDISEAVRVVLNFLEFT